MDALIEEYLARVEGGKEALAAIRRELDEQQEVEAAQNMREEERLMRLERSGEARRGVGKLPESF